MKYEMRCTHSFTIEDVNDQLEKILKEQKIIRTLDLRHNCKAAWISRDIRPKREETSTSPELETASNDNTSIQGTMFEYEGLD